MVWLGATGVKFLGTACIRKRVCGLGDIAILIGIVLAAGLVTGIAGFGFSLVAVATLATARSLPEAVVIVNVISLFVCSYKLWTVRDDLNWRDAMPLIVSSLPMTVLGTFLLQSLEARWLEWILAAAILVGCVVALWSPKEAVLHRAYPGSIVAGLLSGLLGGVLATGGPPVALYCMLRGWDKRAIKAVLSAYFAVMAVWRLVVLFAQGVATPASASLGLALLVPSLAGTYLGMRVFKRLSTTTFKYATSALLLVLAARLVIA